MSHNISDFVIRVKNAIRAKHSYVKIRNTKLNRSLSHLLRSEGFINGFTYTNSKGWANLVAKTVGQNDSETALTEQKRKTYKTSRFENPSELQPGDGITNRTDSEGIMCEENTSGLRQSLSGAWTPEGQRSKDSDFIIVYLKSKDTGKRNAITEMKVISKPSARMYSSAKTLPKVLGGLGTVIVSTSKGVMTDKKARSLKIGGELLFSIW